MTTQITGEVIPSDKPGCMAMAMRQPAGVVRRHRAVERAGHPGRARGRDAAGLRQHRRAEVGRDLPDDAPADRRRAARAPACRAGAVNVVSNAPADATGRGRRADRAPGGAARQLHRLDAGRPPDRRELRAAPQARCCSNSAARRRCWCSTTPTSTRRCKAAAFGAFMNQGQICMRTERIDRRRDAWPTTSSPSSPPRHAALRAGVPGTEGCVLGSMISRDAAAPRARDDRRRRHQGRDAWSPAARSTARSCSRRCSTT